ncbi:MAG: zinc dependent phospholipase C family protein [Nitrososphaerota archaeon]
MPKYATHMLVMDKATEKLLKSKFADAAALKNRRDIAVIGAIGPDLFFWATDYELCKVLKDIFEAWDYIVGIYNDTIGKIVKAIEELGEAVEGAIEKVLPHTVEMIEVLINECKETSELFKKVVSQGALAALLGIDDLIGDMANVPTATHKIFDMFKPPLQDGKDETKWYWFDMLHYRYTGLFLKNLIENARTEAQKAYAYGYATHIATDLIGHGYVNQIVGGPYRTQVQRHSLVEYFIDAWVFREYYGGDVSLELLEKMNLPESLPDDVVDLIYNAFIKTYSDKKHPQLLKSNNGFLTKEQIKETYKLFKRVTELMEVKIEKPKEPFSNVMEILQEALEGFEPPPPPPSKDGDICWEALLLGLTKESRECWEKIAETIADYLEWLGDLLEWTFETLLDLFDFILTALTAIPVSILIAILYGIQLLLYNILNSLREALAFSALAYPPLETLDSTGGLYLVHPYHCEFPKKPYPQIHSCSQNCLQCPSKGSEKPLTIPSLYNEDATPKSFIEEIPLNLKYLDMYAKAKTPEETRKLYLIITGVAAPGMQEWRKIGNAIDLSVWMISNSKDPLIATNWNLDSDRGYAYKHWKGILPTRDPENEVIGEAYLEEYI